ncbi:MAG: protein serine/threonine phosphatase 2C family protein [Chlamydiia bacterium]|nr:protein serine/threonine phosphatase 2C family protein [Chlamydiia bacterium]
MKYSFLEHPNTYCPAQSSEDPGRWYAADVYAKRHREMAGNFPHKAKGHLLIAKIEAMPVIGLVAGILEEIAIDLFANWVDHRKMRSNLKEAFTQHTGPEIARWNEIDHTPANNIRVEISQAENQGAKDRMEDRATNYTDPKGCIGCIFDGHLGSGVADFLERKRFSIEQEYVRIRMRQQFRCLQNEISQNRSLDNQGSTATVVAIDTQKGLATTATVGDSYAFLYRKVKGRIVAIPLSPVRNWHHEKEIKRAQETTPDFQPVASIKKPRFYGFEVSRSLGDQIPEQNTDNIFSRSPKVTEIALQVNDIIVVASDGLWDTKKQSDIIQAINPSSNDIAGDIINTINLSARNQDNVAIVAMRILN